MAWVTFTGVFRWPPLAPASTTFRPRGEAVSVKRECARAAIAAGKAVKAQTPPRTPAEPPADA